MAKTTTFILSDESINTYGFRVLLDGIDTSQFLRNPVMYLNHNDWVLPIGRWDNIRTDEGKLMGDPIFDLEDDEAKKIAGKVERGFLKMASIGFRVLERSEEPELMLPGQKYGTVTKCQLREVSIVGIGANHNAIRLYDENDKLLSDDDIFKLFDNPRAENLPPVQTKTSMKKETFQILSLADNTNDEQLHDAIKNIVDKNTQLEADNKTLSDKMRKIDDDAKAKRKADAVTLTDKAIKDGYYDAKMRETILGLFDKDFDGTKQMIEGLPKRTTLKDALDNVSDKSELEKLMAQSWDELDKGGKLAQLKDKYPESYKEKFAEKFGK